VVTADERPTVRMLPIRPDVDPDDRTAYVEGYRPPVPARPAGRHRAQESNR
jgi:hypothetical protein